MPRNTAVGKVAIGPANASDKEIINILTPQTELATANTKLNGYKDCLKLETPLYLAITY